MRPPVAAVGGGNAPRRQRSQGGASSKAAGVYQPRRATPSRSFCCCATVRTASVFSILVPTPPYRPFDPRRRSAQPRLLLWGDADCCLHVVFEQRIGHRAAEDNLFQGSRLLLGQRPSICRLAFRSVPCPCATHRGCFVPPVTIWRPRRRDRIIPSLMGNPLQLLLLAAPRPTLVANCGPCQFGIRRRETNAYLNHLVSSDVPAIIYP